MGDTRSGKVCREKMMAEPAVLRGTCLATQTRETHVELNCA